MEFLDIFNTAVKIFPVFMQWEAPDQVSLIQCLAGLIAYQHETLTAQRPADETVVELRSVG